MKIEFLRIPLPPSVNNMYVNISSRPGVKRRGRAKSIEYIHWLKLMQVWMAQNSTEVVHARSELKSLSINSMLVFESVFNFRMDQIYTRDGLPKRNDHENRLKALHDAVCEMIGIDDKWIFKIYSEKYADRSIVSPHVDLVIKLTSNF
jgi:hypothetical protein